MACSRDHKRLIEQYLDEEITLAEARQLEDHVKVCPDCRQHLNELKKTVAIVQSASHFEAPEDMTEKVMNRLPKQTKSKKWNNWLRRNPFLITAATFFLVFAISLSTAFGGEEEIVVKGEGHFIIDDAQKLVIIPEGSTVSGDLLIRNGNVEINGEVAGDVTVINGEHLQASTASIGGEIEEVNETMEFIWYETKSFFKEVVPFSPDEDARENNR
ncbi:zf-HC2 domain-containing protein [Alkalicoccus halolimnae]|uniref:Anti-sigma-W factor RsiW n=1 Tax=Alkalicoccus halolimnae TaxID=1667239 RepID=A0A5C7F778_9BACI|nr:zf-HC2 domain-containing protein [Alkalicoccus halolimnae]TXF85258.1 anti-sigma factor [Alkalicoccus halolimnae]